jgi:hypothetical protein
MWIVYVDSSNMNYVKHENGQEAIHPKYNKWIKNLLKSARSVAKAERRHENSESLAPVDGNLSANKPVLMCCVVLLR